MPNMRSCAAVNALLCHPLCGGLETLKSLQQPDWLPATFFLSEKRRIDLCKLKQAFQIWLEIWLFRSKRKLLRLICEAVSLRQRIESGCSEIESDFLGS